MMFCADLLLLLGIVLILLHKPVKKLEKKGKGIFKMLTLR